MKKIVSALFCFLLVSVVFAGCSYTSSGGTNKTPEDSKGTETTSPVSLFRARAQQSGSSQQVIFQFAFKEEFGFGDFDLVDYYPNSLKLNAYVAEIEQIIGGEVKETWLDNDIIFYATADDQLIVSARNKLWSQHLNLLEDREDRNSTVTRIGNPNMGMSNIIIAPSINNDTIENSANLLSGMTIQPDTEWQANLIVIDNGKIFRHKVSGTGATAIWAQ